MQYNFGTGLLEFTPAGANPTPLQCGVLQEVSVDIDQTMKDLYGQYKFPVDTALADGKISGKAKFGIIYGAIVNQVLSGSSLNSGSTAAGINEVGTIPGSGPYTVTVAQSATFVEDLGVVDANTGLRMIRVASAPATGQYAVTAGVYTFAAADTAHVVWISYSYTTAGGKTVVYNNQLMGAATTFTCTLFNTYAGKQFGIKLFATVFPKFSYAMKNTDYTMPALDFTARADATQRVIEHYTTE
jgi:hypothetical protein